MKLLVVVTPPYIYHGFPTRKTFWEGNFRLVNMKNGGRWNVRKQRGYQEWLEVHPLGHLFEIWWFGLYANRIFRSKLLFGKISKGFYFISGSQDHWKVKEEENSKYAINNVIMNDLSPINKEFEKLPCKGFCIRGPNLNLLTVTFSSKTTF